MHITSRLVWGLALVGILAACGDKDPADSGGGGETDATDATDGTDAQDATDSTDGTDGTSDGTDGTTETIGVTDLSVSDCGDGGGTPRLEAALASGTSIAVRHERFEGNCCADLQVTVSQDADELYVLYTDVGDPCDCLCNFDLSYTLEPVPSGTWTVAAAGGVSATVTVP